MFFNNKTLSAQVFTIFIAIAENLLRTNGLSVILTLKTGIKVMKSIGICTPTYYTDFWSDCTGLLTIPVCNVRLIFFSRWLVSAEPRVLIRICTASEWIRFTMYSRADQYALWRSVLCGDQHCTKTARDDTSVLTS